MSKISNTRERVQTILTNKLGSVNVDRDGDIKLEYESTMISISVTEQGEWTFVNLTSPIAINANPRSESKIYEWCNRVNMILDFGSVVYSYDPDNPGKNFTIIRHTLLGNFLDPDELMSAVFAIVHAANDVDEMFVQEFGGKRYSDS